MLAFASIMDAVRCCHATQAQVTHSSPLQSLSVAGSLAGLYEATGSAGKGFSADGGPRVRAGVVATLPSVKPFAVIATDSDEECAPSCSTDKNVLRACSPPHVSLLCHSTHSTPCRAACR